ncbi:MAG: 2-C-methyl-D-erythritol 4-phosphate cytidylyltransferase [Bacilli bacterium]|nr:2-C-methyl-D-erythritol 4-phosphate cytidylyltransferase [Bacilli bacterium]
MKNIGVILAAGTGSRIGGEIPKQFLLFNGKELFVHSLLTFTNCKEIDEIVLVVNDLYIDNYINIVKKYEISKKIVLINGGKTRQDSVFNAIKYISENEENAIVLVHDAARPYVSEKIVLDNIEAVKKFGCSTTAIPSTNSIYLTNNGEFDKEVDRDLVYIAQTPQSGYLSVFKKAFENIDKIYTDEAAIFASAGYVPHIVIGDEKNIKITYPNDLQK